MLNPGKVQTGCCVRGSDYRRTGLDAQAAGQRVAVGVAQHEGVISGRELIEYGIIYCQLQCLLCLLRHITCQNIVPRRIHRLAVNDQRFEQI